nr:MAG TPA: hypothetical protein [Caudoviricetes sp.]
MINKCIIRLSNKCIIRLSSKCIIRLIIICTYMYDISRYYIQYEQKTLYYL